VTSFHSWDEVKHKIFDADDLDEIARNSSATPTSASLPASTPTFDSASNATPSTPSAPCSTAPRPSNRLTATTNHRPALVR
jgi:hypothetical protein